MQAGFAVGLKSQAGLQPLQRAEGSRQSVIANGPQRIQAGLRRRWLRRWTRRRA